MRNASSERRRVGGVGVVLAILWKPRQRYRVEVSEVILVLSRSSSDEEVCNMVKVVRTSGWW